MTQAIALAAIDLLLIRRHHRGARRQDPFAGGARWGNRSGQAGSDVTYPHSSRIRGIHATGSSVVVRWAKTMSGLQAECDVKPAFEVAPTCLLIFLKNQFAEFLR